MIVRSLTVLAAATALTATAAMAPAAAKKPEVPGSQSSVKGTTTLMFTKSVKKKLAKDGILVKAVAPAKKRNAVKFTFPAKQAEPGIITHTGGLSFVRADAGLTLTDFVFDLENGTVDATVPGTGPLEDVFDMAKVKITKKQVTAKLNVSMGKAAVLNDALKTTMFSDGMYLAKAATRF
jgi:hypothetical protein